MPGSHADEIVGDYVDPDDWAEKTLLQRWPNMTWS